jgi:predicted Zn-dependent protease
MEVLVGRDDGQLTRFAANAIHQNVSETDLSVRVRAVIGRRVGVASGNDVSDAALERLVAAAETAARFQEDNPDFRSLPEPRPVESLAAYVMATAQCTPTTRAQGAATVCRLAAERGLEAAGAFRTSAEELLIANTLGVSAYHERTTANLMTVVMGDTSSGYASASAMDVTALDAEAIGRRAVDKALRSHNPAAIEPGTYAVILEPDAVASMVSTLGRLGCGALALQEGRSFMNGRLGQRVTGEQITIWDDAHDPRGFVEPFDYEGVPTQAVTLIDAGVARNVVYDTFTAGREEGKASTGHSLPAPNTMGPIPRHLFLAPGTVSLEEMVASTERGIWVTRFHYTNPVHPVKTVLTGMTRDGTFLIEHGEVARPLKNLRFTQSILEALASASMIGAELELIAAGWGGMATCVPALKIDAFSFTGTTEF